MIALAVIWGIPSLAFSQTAKEASVEVKLTFKNPFVSPLPKKEIAAKDIPATTRATVKEIQEPKITPPNLVISGLVWNTPRPQAIVNEQVVTIGDSIGDIKVLSINSQSIEIEFQGKRFVIPADKKTQSIETAQGSDTITERDSY